MLSIIGGTYREICQEPNWNELYGSGLRAAIAIADLTSGTQLFTLIGSDERRELERKAKSFDVALHANSIAATVRFIYNHPLSTPSIYPSVEKLFTQKQKINVTEENILIFGMLEADSVARADYAVYDPQSPNNPRPFNIAGSTAKHLAVILNYWEAKQLTRQEDLDAMGQQLLDNGAEVVVIKQGSAGASVFEAGKRTNIAAYQTTNVWPIGSGDIFSAIFAHYWAEQRTSASDAADHASLATAFYCQTQTLPIPKDPEVIASLNLKYLPSRGHICKSIYLAGPFFTMAERWLINESRLALQQTGNKVFSPLHDVGHGVADVVVPLDLEALDTCDVVFAIVDGLDSGTLFEVGYARALGKRVVAFVQNEAPENLKMLQGSDCIICSDFSTAVYTINWLP